MIPERQINTTIENLTLAITEWAAVKNGLITTKNLPNIVDWKLGNGTTIRITNTVKDNQLELYFTNQLRAAFAVSSIQANSALESVYGKQRLDDKDLDRRAARCSIYMMRCSVGHNPLEPIWVCHSGFRERFQVQSIGFVLDMRSLDGQIVEWEQFGGPQKFLDLLNYCRSLLLGSK